MAFQIFPLDNTGYEAKDFGAYTGTRTRGVFSGEEHYSVTAGDGMRVVVSSGLAWLQVSDFYGAAALNDSSVTLDIALSDAVMNRIDAVCVRLNKLSNTPEIIIRQGAYGVNPVPPAVQRDADYEELFVAYVRVNSGVVDITAGMIEDQRLNEDVCGIMRDGVTGIPTSTLYATANTVIEQIRGLLTGVLDGSEYMLATEYRGSATGVVKDSDALGGLEAQGYSLVQSGVFEYQQSVSGNTVYLDSKITPSGFTPIYGAVMIETAIPASPVFIVDGVTVPAYLGEDSVEELPLNRWAYFVYDGTQVNFNKGGAGYAFRLYAVTALPATAREKDLAVLTESAITDWTFSAQQPTGTEGRVWIKTGVTSPVAFNALKKNSLLVYPLACYQYTGSVWISKRAFLYTSGAWAEFGFNFYDSGVFGGGATGATITGGSSTLQAAYIDLLVYSSSEAFYRSTVSLTPKIDVTELNTLRFTLDCVAWSTTIKNYDAVTVGLMNNLSNTEAFVASIGTRLETAGIVLTIDVSARTGEYYLAARVSGYGTGHATNYRIRKIEGV